MKRKILLLITTLFLLMQGIANANTYRKLVIYFTDGTQASFAGASTTVLRVNKSQKLVVSTAYGQETYDLSKIRKMKIDTAEGNSSISLDKVDDLAEGNTLKMKANVNSPVASSKEVIWSSSNPSIISIDKQGILTARKQGEATITAVVADGSGAKAEVKCTVYLLGDANGNGHVSVTDVNTVVDFKNEVMPATFIYAAANANFANNNAINVADIALINNIILKGSSKVPELKATNSRLYANAIDMEAGTEATLSILIDNPDQQVSAFEFSLQLPEGVSVKSNNNGTPMAYMSTERASFTSHEFKARVKDNGELYVLCYASDNTRLNGTQGIVANITLTSDIKLSEQNAKMRIHDIMLTDGGEEIAVADQQVDLNITASGIEQVVMPETEGYIYTTDGRLISTGHDDIRFEELPKGLYIVNGQVKMKN